MFQPYTVSINPSLPYLFRNKVQNNVCGRSISYVPCKYKYLSFFATFLNFDMTIWEEPQTSKLKSLTILYLSEICMLTSNSSRNTHSALLKSQVPLTVSLTSLLIQSCWRWRCSLVYMNERTRRFARSMQVYWLRHAVSNILQSSIILWIGEMRSGLPWWLPLTQMVHFCTRDWLIYWWPRMQAMIMEIAHAVQSHNN